MSDHSASRHVDVLRQEAPELVAEPGKMPPIAGYRVTFTVDTYDEVLAIHRSFLLAIPSVPRRVLVQALDESGRPLWTPPADEHEAER